MQKSVSGSATSGSSRLFVYDVDWVGMLPLPADQVEGVDDAFAFHDRLAKVDQLRPNLTKAIDRLQAGDTLRVRNLLALASTLAGVISVYDMVQERAAILVIRDLDLTTETASGRASMELLRVVAQFEFDVRYWRYRQGVERAKSSGKNTGRPKTSSLIIEEARALRRQGVSGGEIAKRLGLHKNTIYRLLKSAVGPKSERSDAS